jgi:RimJ/RimL family protein N-acetyltransferase
MNDQVVLETARLRLRPHRVADFESYAALWPPSQASQDIDPLPPLTREEAWARLLRFVGHWTHFGYGLFLVEDARTGELIGEMGCAHFCRGVQASFDSALESGWRLVARRRRQGIAVEAMLAALAWVDSTLRVERTVCMIDPGNLPSLQVAARLRYQEFAREPYKGNSVILLERRRQA